MTDTRKPRHIRDIAHLYISRMEKREPDGPVNVVLLGTTRDCFPGFHAANIAVGLSSIRKPVRVVELSGLWPCSAHFLSLPPQIYLRPHQPSLDEDISAVGSVSIRFTLPRRNRETARAGAGARLRKRSSAGAFEVYHLPPVEQMDDASEVYDAAVAFVSEPKRVVLLAMDKADADAAWKKTGRFWGAAQRYTVLLAGPGAGFELPEHVASGVRRLNNWRRSLSDAIPCAVRAPDSYLSRAYAAICEALSSTALTSRGKNVPGFVSSSRAAGPAW